MVRVAARGRCRRGERGAGYNLVALAVLITVLGVASAAALPQWTSWMQREKEAELIFRGMQYVEAIRVFQQRFGRYPVTLDELIRTQPRSIRRLWVDPFREDGTWGLILAQGTPVAGGAPPDEGPLADGDDGAQTLPTERVDPGGGGFGAPPPGSTTTRGPIIGVRSVAAGESKRTFMGSREYKTWIFTVDLVPTVDPAALGANLPRLFSRWVGRPFPEGIEPQGGGALDGGLPGGGDEGRPDGQPRPDQG